MLKKIKEKLEDALDVSTPIVEAMTLSPMSTLATFQCPECQLEVTLLLCGKCRECASELHEWAYNLAGLTDEQKCEMRKATCANT